MGKRKIALDCCTPSSPLAPLIADNLGLTLEARPAQGLALLRTVWAKASDTCVLVLPAKPFAQRLAAQLYRLRNPYGKVLYADSEMLRHAPHRRTRPLGECHAAAKHGLQALGGGSFFLMTKSLEYKCVTDKFYKKEKP